MNFLVNPFQPAATAAGVAVSRVQLPTAGRVSAALPTPKRTSAPTAEPGRAYADGAAHRAQHRAECRAACRSKANF